MPAMNQEDEALLCRLRDKYSKHVVPVDPNSTDEWRSDVDAVQHGLVPSANMGNNGLVPGKASDSSVEAKICTVCNGTGVKVESYDHRRLESFCTSCHGQGINVFKHGVEVIQETKPMDREDPLKKMIREKRNRIEADIELIDSKLASYAEEMVRADDRAQDSEAARLVQALKSQIQTQVDKLTKLRGVKVESLAKVKAGPAVLEEV